ncbi:MAG: DUF3576 domain-containing protein [Rhodobacteraceae bacterium]|nr:DUF3576 domain-containing protein [Paracoccaceae bacterium]
MTRIAAKASCAALLCAGLTACGSVPANTGGPAALENQRSYHDNPANADRSTLFDLFGNHDDPNVTLEVNRYIWTAAMEVLNFLPIESADPFSGVIVMGYGTPPGGRTPYRATVYVQDPALDARSLKVALATRSGPASTDTVRAVEDAILTRARQLRIQDQGY